MKQKLRYALLIIVSTLVAAQAVAQSINGTQCINKDHHRSFFNQFKINQYKNNTTFSDDELAFILSNCLGNPDPKLRDGIAYEGLVSLLRGNRVSNKAKHQLLKKYYKALSINQLDPNGFLKPFVALSLAEVARTDRIKAFLNQQQRIELVNVAANNLSSITDYRGFNKAEGWRHGVAHASDLLMQLTLNKNIGKEQHWIILQAISKQASQHHTAYTFGEPDRLARPVLFIAARDTISEKQWVSFLKQISSAEPLLNNWNEMYASSKGLKKHHNVKAFLNALYINASNSKNENIKKLEVIVLEALKIMP